MVSKFTHGIGNLYPRYVGNLTHIVGKFTHIVGKFTHILGKFTHILGKFTHILGRVYPYCGYRLPIWVSFDTMLYPCVRLLKPMFIMSDV